MKNEINAYLKERGIAIIGEYLALREATDFKCFHCGHIWLARPLYAEHMECPACKEQREYEALRAAESERSNSKTKAGNQKQKEAAIERIRTRFAELGYTQIGEYVSSGIPFAIRCNEGHEIEFKIVDLGLDIPCKECRRGRRKYKKQTSDQLISKFMRDFAKYEYIPLDEFNRKSWYVTVKCQCGGVFNLYAASHYCGIIPCPNCRKPKNPL